MNAASQANHSKQLVVGIVLFDDVEVLDFAGPYEVLAASQDETGRPHARVITIAEHAEVCCRGGLRVIAENRFLDCLTCDVLLVPGGPGARTKSDAQSRVVEFVRETSARVGLVASICTGSFLLAQAALLDGRRATTHSSRLEELRQEYPAVDVVAEKIVDEGSIVTAAGASSGIDLALHLLDREFGRSVRDREARRLDGPW